MKKRISLLTLTLLSACSNQLTSNDFTKTVTYDYEDFVERTISFDNLFGFELDDYYVYIYSKTCSHCENIKQEVLSFVNDYECMYLLPYSKEIPISEDVETTIGATSIEAVSILGTPTLLEIKDHALIINVAGENKIITTLQGINN